MFFLARHDSDHDDDDKEEETFHINANGREMGANGREWNLNFREFSNANFR